jgi:hypothetical protein
LSPHRDDARCRAGRSRRRIAPACVRVRRGWRPMPTSRAWSVCAPRCPRARRRRCMHSAAPDRRRSVEGCIAASVREPRGLRCRLRSRGARQCWRRRTARSSGSSGSSSRRRTRGPRAARSRMRRACSRSRCADMARRRPTPTGQCWLSENAAGGGLSRHGMGQEALAKKSGEASAYAAELAALRQVGRYVRTCVCARVYMHVASLVAPADAGGVRERRRRAALRPVRRAQGGGVGRRASERLRWRSRPRGSRPS